MNARRTEAAVRVGCALLGLMWIVAAASKALRPEDAYEFTARVVSGGIAAKAVVTLVAAGEALLGVTMLLGAVRGLVATAIGLGAATAALAWVRSTAGGKVHCGCLALLADSSVDQALVRNAWVLAGVFALGVLAFVTRRRGRDAPAAPGPSTP